MGLAVDVLAELVPAGLFFVLSFIIPESPRWLATVQKTTQARNILIRIGGDQYADQTLNELAQLTGKQEEKVNWSALLQPGVRNVLIIGIVLAIFQQWCGINVIFNYAHEIFSEAGYAVSDVLMNIVVTGVTNVIFTFVAIYTVDKWGQKKPDVLVGSARSWRSLYAILGTCYFFGISGWLWLLLVVIGHCLLCHVAGPGCMGCAFRDIPGADTRNGDGDLDFLPLGGLLRANLYVPDIE